MAKFNLFYKDNKHKAWRQLLFTTIIISWKETENRYMYLEFAKFKSYKLFLKVEINGLEKMKNHL